MAAVATGVATPGKREGEDAAAAAVVVVVVVVAVFWYRPGSGARVLTSRPTSSDAKQWSSFCSRAKVGRGEGGNEGRYVVRAEATLMR